MKCQPWTVGTVFGFAAGALTGLLGWWHMMWARSMGRWVFTVGLLLAIAIGFLVGYRIQLRRRTAKMKDVFTEARRVWRDMALRCSGSRDGWDPSQAQVEQRFDSLEKTIDTKRNWDEEAVAEARSLSRMRAHLMTAEHIQIAGGAIRKDLQQWGAPQLALDAADELLLKIKSSDLRAARLGLEELFSDHEYWRQYDDEWQAELRRAAWAGLPLVAVTLVGSFILLARGQTVIGFVLASATGSGMSVLLRLPRLLPYGEVADVWVRAFVRYLAGVVAGAIGLGILSSGLINPFPLVGSAGILEIARQCSSICPITYQALLFALGLGFGFSERGLSVLGESVLGTGHQGNRARAKKTTPGARAV